MSSFLKARKAVLFQRAVVDARRREQAAARRTSDKEVSGRENAVRDQQKRIKKAFGDKDAA